MTTSIAERQVVRLQRQDVVAVATFVAVAAGALWWAKWAPYSTKVRTLTVSHAWSGDSLLAAAGIRQGSAPSVSAGLHVTHLYWLAIWRALVAALLISAAVQTLLPREWITGVLSRRTRAGSAVVGGVLGLPR